MLPLHRITTEITELRADWRHWSARPRAWVRGIIEARMVEREARLALIATVMIDDVMAAQDAIRRAQEILSDARLRPALDALQASTIWEPAMADDPDVVCLIGMLQVGQRFLVELDQTDDEHAELTP